MANAKVVEVVHEAGATLYLTVRRLLDNYLLNDATGLFAAPAPADFFISLTADTYQASLYRKSESRAAWSDGVYLVIIYRQLGGSPAVATDPPIKSGYMVMLDDQEQAQASTADSLSSVLSSLQNNGSVSSASFAKLQELVKTILKNTDVLVTAQQNAARFGPKT